MLRTRIVPPNLTSFAEKTTKLIKLSVAGYYSNKTELIIVIRKACDSKGN